MGRRGTLLLMIFLLLGCACAEKAVDITYRFGSREEQKIAVTIDDCYHAEDVRAVLDILQANDVRATFFPSARHSNMRTRRYGRRLWRLGAKSAITHGDILT